MKPSLLALRTPFVLGSLAVHMFAAAVTASLPSAKASKPAGPLVYSRPGGELDTRPPGEPDFYLVLPRPSVIPYTEDCVTEESFEVIVCTASPCSSALGIPLPDDVEERLLRLRLENAAMRARTTPGNLFHATYRVPGRRPPAAMRR